MSAGGPAPQVSVVTIFHDEERFLPEAVASVEAQDGVTWELLLVDDGSTDGSSAWARAAAARDPERIRYLTHPDGANHGMSATRNLGIAGARGDWLTFLDADDVWRPGKLEAQLVLLEDHPEIEVLVSPAQWWRSWDPAGEQRPDWLQSLGAEGGPATVAPPALVQRFLDDEWSSLCDLVMRREVVEQVGGYEPRFRGMFEDQVFHAKVFTALPALVTAEWWYRYRQHPSATTAQAHAAGGHDRARKQFLQWLDRHLATSDATHPELRAQVRRHLLPHRFRLAYRIGRRLRRAWRGPG